MIGATLTCEASQKENNVFVLRHMCSILGENNEEVTLLPNYFSLGDDADTLLSP